MTRLPYQKKWYRERLKICGGCEYNSKFKKKEDKSMWNRITDFFGIGAICTACGCVIKRKASVKEEVCGLEELDLEPKWKEVK